MSNFKQFYRKTIHERIAILENDTHTDLSLLKEKQTLPIELAHTIVENAIGIYGVPLGVAPNFLIDQTLFHAPMATEEPSVIAAASYGAAIIKQSGGFTILENTRAMIGHIAFDVSALLQTNLQQLQQWQTKLHEHRDECIAVANDAYPSIVKRGGGAQNIWSAIKTSADHTHTFFIVYLSVDTQEAMGANMLNTMLEALKAYLEQLFNASALMAILSNFALESLVHATCRIPFTYLKKANTTLSGEQVALKMVQAYQFASADIFRATTHNKGVMNGISAVVLATGNDTRAIEAGIHAFASQHGNYQPITTWQIKDGMLEGSIKIPLPIGYVGGSIGIHPNVTLNQQLSKTKNAKQLAALIACVGLAQNFSALRALVSEGIQQGHMKLHLNSLLLSAGATVEELPILSEQLKHVSPLNLTTVTEQLAKLRQNSTK